MWWVWWGFQEVSSTGDQLFGGLWREGGRSEGGRERGEEGGRERGGKGERERKRERRERERGEEVRKRGRK